MVTFGRLYWFIPPRENILPLQGALEPAAPIDPSELGGLHVYHQFLHLTWPAESTSLEMRHHPQPDLGTFEGICALPLILGVRILLLIVLLLLRQDIIAASNTENTRGPEHRFNYVRH